MRVCGPRPKSAHAQQARLYVAEAYTSRSSRTDLKAIAERATAAAAAITAPGRPVRYMRTVFLPDDETCFHLFEADAAEQVRQAVRRAGIECERIVQAEQVC
jgi:hypothetical protein